MATWPSSENGMPLSPSSTLEGPADGVVLVAHELLEVGQRHLAGGAVALLGDDDLDDAVVLPRLVAVGPVQHHDGVRVLLKRSGFSQIRQARSMVLPIFRGAIDLGQGDDGNAQFPRQKLE